MKILVPIKRVVDFNVKVRLKADGSSIETSGVKMSMNPFCEIAVEEAIRQKEKGKAEEVIVVSIGEAKTEETLRSALAMGADRAIHVVTDKLFQPLTAAKILKKLVESEGTNLVILGKQAVDDDNNQTGQMLAALLGWGQGTFASKLEIMESQVHVTREVDGGLMMVELKLPAIVTTDLRLNEPRYVALPNIMKARAKPLVKKTPEELGVEMTATQKTIKLSEPQKRARGIKVKDVAELVDKLKNEAKVL